MAARVPHHNMPLHVTHAMGLIITTWRMTHGGTCVSLNYFTWRIPQCPRMQPKEPFRPWESRREPMALFRSWERQTELMELSRPWERWGEPTEPFKPWESCPACTVESHQINNFLKRQLALEKVVCAFKHARFLAKHTQAHERPEACTCASTCCCTRRTFSSAAAAALSADRSTTRQLLSKLLAAHSSSSMMLAILAASAGSVMCTWWDSGGSGMNGVVDWGDSGEQWNGWTVVDWGDSDDRVE